MGQVFLSHASDDDAAVNTLAAWLEAERAGKLFVDHRDINPGDPWDRELPRQLRRSDAALLYVTRNWLESDECFAEYRASYYGSKPVVPVFVGKPDEEDSLLLSTTQYGLWGVLGLRWRPGGWGAGRRLDQPGFARRRDGRRRQYQTR